MAPGLFAKQGSASGSSSIPAALLSAEVVSATLDLVVLEDGTVLGPDASNTVGDLRARKAAIDSMVNAVRAAEQNGQDGVEVLRQLARPPRQGGLGAMELSAIAHSLMISRRWREQLERLAALQLPNSHR